MRALFFICSLFVCFGSLAQQADTTSTDLFNFSLEELMNVKLNVSKTNLSLREAPSIVSVITREEIKSMGARDLMDVLNQVPGFNFGLDVQNAVGLGTRGNWGHEGKILLLIDGNEMNEIMFGNTFFGQHYDINNIDKIEIIRGPGSSLYGGFAELGVINIITRSGLAANEIGMGLSYGAVDGGTSRQNVNFNIGRGSEKINYSLSGIYGEGIRSSRIYTDATGAQVDMTNTSTLRPLMLNGNLTVGAFSASLIFDDYQISSADQVSVISPDTITKVSFRTFYASLKYNAKINNKVTVTPKVNFKTGNPWKSITPSPVPYAVDASRLAPSVSVAIEASEQVDLLFGVDSYFDHAVSLLDDSYFSSLGEGSSASLYNIGVYGQGVFKTPISNFIVGSRFDNHSRSGSAFSPRLGITKAWSRFHYKALYSRAFRSTTFENLSFTPNLQPEKTGVAELELGYKINDNMALTANGYYISISQPIVYTVDDDHPDGTFANFDQAGSIGFELDFKAKYQWGSLSANYAYYSAKDINKVSYYTVPTDDNEVLAMPGGRVNLLSDFKMSKIFSISTFVNILSKRYGVTRVEGGEFVYSEVNPQLIANIFLRAKKNNFDAGIGLYNLTDENQHFIQPYSGGHAPLPGLGREIAIKLQYTMPFRK